MEKYEYDRICTIANLVLKNYKIETPILDMKKSCRTTKWKISY